MKLRQYYTETPKSKDMKKENKNQEIKGRTQRIREESGK